VRIVNLADGSRIRSRAVVIATGVSYRRLAGPRLKELEGAGVFYGAASSEATAMKGREVFVVGAANSAGQAAAHLARFASRVTILARGSSLADSMSEYLVTQIETTPNIVVRYAVEVIDAGGRGQLESVTIRDRRSGAVETATAGGLFVMIGAEPHTDWLPDAIARDPWGFLLTGGDLIGDIGTRQWPLARPPAVLESSVPGVFAVGDVRHGSIKRVAAAVGEGSTVIHSIHQFLRDA
jgi:thioredoxin reductase (NADPH)